MKTKEPYTLEELRETARKTGCKLATDGAVYMVRHDSQPEFERCLTRQVAHTRMHMLAAEHTAKNPPPPAPNLKIVVMTEDGRVIDEQLQVRLHHGSLEEMRRYNATLIRWLMSTAAAAEDMQRDGRINGMPRLRKCEGKRRSLYQLRKELYQQTHKPFVPQNLDGLWNRIEELLKMTEEML